MRRRENSNELIENRISPLAPALPIFNNPPIINILQPLVAPLSSFDFFESFSSATWLKPSTHNGAIVTPYNLGRHNLETLYHQKGKEGSLLSIFRQNTKHFFDKNIPFSIPLPYLVPKKSERGKSKVYDLCKWCN